MTRCCVTRASWTDLGDLPLRVPAKTELRRAAQRYPPEIRKRCGNGHRKYPRSSPKRSCRANAFEEFSPGRKLGWIVRPLDAVGCYVPSGRYPLPSTLLMTAVLAQTAGVPRICVTSPQPSSEILGCAHMLGYHRGLSGRRRAGDCGHGVRHEDNPTRGPHRRPWQRLCRGGKKLLAGEVGIDFVAGPTEILILAADRRSHK